MPLHSSKIWLNAQKYLFLQEIINLITNNYEKELCKIEMAFHDAFVRDNHDYANHDVGGKYYSKKTER